MATARFPGPSGWRWGRICLVSPPTLWVSLSGDMFSEPERLAEAEVELLGGIVSGPGGTAGGGRGQGQGRAPGMSSPAGQTGRAARPHSPLGLGHLTPRGQEQVDGLGGGTAAWAGQTSLSFPPCG